MSSSQRFFRESKEFAHTQILDSLLEARELTDAGKTSGSEVEEKAVGTITDASLSADDKNLLLACAYHVFSLRSSSEIQQTLELKEPKRDAKYYQQLAVEKLKLVVDSGRIQSLLKAHPQADQLKFISTFGFICPELIENYILKNKSNLHPEEIGHIKRIFRFYNPAYKKILECLRDNCEPAILYNCSDEASDCLVSRKLYSGGSIRFLNDILDVMTQCDHQKFVTGFTSDCDAFRELKWCIQLSLAYVELHIDPRERGGYTEEEREKFYIPWSRDYDAFLQKLLRISEFTPEIFDQENDRLKLLRNKHGFQNFVKRLIALKSLPNAEQVEAFIKETRKWTLRKWPEENRAYVRSLSVKAASLIAKHINLKKPIPADAKAFADDHENLEEAISLLLKNDFPDTHKVAARNLLLDLHKVLLKTFIPTTTATVVLPADEKEFKSALTKRATS